LCLLCDWYVSGFSSCTLGLLQPVHTVISLGKRIDRPTHLDAGLTTAIYDCRHTDNSNSSETHYTSVVLGKTLAVDCFYEGQSRLDGAVCEYTVQDKMTWLRTIYDSGVRNIEMESLVFAAFCTKFNIRGACVCAVIVNRMISDQITSTHDELASYSEAALNLVLRFIARDMQLSAAEDLASTVQTHKGIVSRL